jgi:hypothetical protein
MTAKAGQLLHRREGGARPSDERVRVRQARAKSIVNDLESWLQAQLPRISDRPELAKVIRYALARMRKLRPYLDQGCLETDNNGAERNLKPVAVLERMISGRTKANELERLLPWTWKMARPIDT